MQFLDDLREKSPEVKAYYGFAFAGTITGIIALVWVSTVPARFSKEAQMQEDTPGVMDTFFGESTEQLANVIETVTPPRVETEAEVPPLGGGIGESVSIDQEANLPSPDSALGRLGGEGGVVSQVGVVSTATQATGEQVLARPEMNPLPVGAVTVPVPQVSQETTSRESASEVELGQKPVLIEVKPVSKNPILIGTSTVQKSE